MPDENDFVVREGDAEKAIVDLIHKRADEFIANASNHVKMSEDQRAAIKSAFALGCHETHKLSVPEFILGVKPRFSIQVVVSILGHVSQENLPLVINSSMDGCASTDEIIKCLASALASVRSMIAQSSKGLPDGSQRDAFINRIVEVANAMGEKVGDELTKNQELRTFRKM